MNVMLTRGAEGLGRRRFTVQDIWRMIDAGIISEDENFELVEGEIVPMSPKYHAHEHVKSALNLAVAPLIGPTLWLGIESSIYFSDDTFLEPDLTVYPRGMKLETVKGADLLLAIEVAVSSRDYDLGKKAALYARFGVREYWVVLAEEREAVIHKGPRADGWTLIERKGPDDVLVTDAVPGLSVRLGAL